MNNSCVLLISELRCKCACVQRTQMFMAQELQVFLAGAFDRIFLKVKMDSEWADKKCAIIRSCENLQLKSSVLEHGNSFINKISRNTAKFSMYLVV